MINLASKYIWPIILALALNFANGSQTSQSSDYNTVYLAGNAVDGDTTNFAKTLETANEWWKVDLQQTIQFHHATIYPRPGKCNDGEFDPNALYECGM